MPFLFGISSRIAVRKYPQFSVRAIGVLCAGRDVEFSHCGRDCAIVVVGVRDRANVGVASWILLF